MAEVGELNSPDRAIDLSGNQDAGVSQADIAYTHPDDKHPILASYGAGPCVIVAAHNPKTGVTALAHIDSLTELNHSVRLMMYSVRGKTPDIVEVHLAGAVEHSGGDITLGKVIQVLDTLDFVEIKSANVARGTDAESLAIDSRTGEVFNQFNPRDLPFSGFKSDQEFDANFQLLALRPMPQPLILRYDGRKLDPDEAENALTEVFSSAADHLRELAKSLLPIEPTTAANSVTLPQEAGEAINTPSSPSPR